MHCFLFLIVYSNLYFYISAGYIYPQTTTPWNVEGESYTFTGKSPATYPNGTYYPGMNSEGEEEGAERRRGEKGEKK